jgi:hypothetical protein
MLCGMQRGDLLQSDCHTPPFTSHEAHPSILPTNRARFFLALAPELARSILVLHQLALHRRPRDGWGSLIRIGSSAATSEQLRRPAATPTAAPAALHR